MATILDAQHSEDGFQLDVPVADGRTPVLMPHLRYRGLYHTLKVVFDFVLALVLLVLAAPVIAICALLVKLTSRGPAFYSQVRLGLGGKPYWIWKLRTMRHECELQSGVQWSQAGDPRITPIGRFMRRTHLDELPQLWNILRGEMSLVGPRPERPEFIPNLAKAIPLYELRMAVRPGVTGLAQVQLPADSDLDSVRIKLAHDLYYVQHATFLMDVRLIAATGLKVLGASFARIRACLRMPTRQAIEQHYERLQTVPASTPELNPALIPST